MGWFMPFYETKRLFRHAPCASGHTATTTDAAAVLLAKSAFHNSKKRGSKRTQPRFNLGLRIRRFGRKKKAIGDKKIPDSI
jgi:hypothetical protein